MLVKQYAIEDVEAGRTFSFTQREIMLNCIIRSATLLVRQVLAGTNIIYDQGTYSDGESS